MSLTSSPSPFKFPLSCASAHAFATACGDRFCSATSFLMFLIVASPGSVV